MSLESLDELLEVAPTPIREAFRDILLLQLVLRFSERFSLNLKSAILAVTVHMGRFTSVNELLRRNTFCFELLRRLLRTRRLSESCTDPIKALQKASTAFLRGTI